MKTANTANAASFAASLACHALVLWLVVAIVGAGHRRFQPTTIDVPAAAVPAHIVWLAQRGNGNGGGSGGDQRPEPPRRAQRSGRDRVTVAVARPRSLEATPNALEPNPLDALVIPAVPMSAGFATLVGAIDGLNLTGLSQGPGDSGGAGTRRGRGDGDGDGDGVGRGGPFGAGDGPYRPGGNVTPPTALYRGAPQYTVDAMRARIQGAVLLECVVETTGTCEQVRVVRSLDPAFGLDSEAVKAARLWRFRPGTRMGRPVPVLVTMEIQFTLR